MLGPNQTKWVESLRSGKYRQGRGYLRVENRYCCLGVGCEIFDIEKHARVQDKILYYEFGKEQPCVSICPDELWEILGFISCSNLVSMNDNGKSFTEIADEIEKNSDKYFGEPK